MYLICFMCLHTMSKFLLLIVCTLNIINFYSSAISEHLAQPPADQQGPPDNSENNNEI